MRIFASQFYRGFLYLGIFLSIISYQNCAPNRTMRSNSGSDESNIITLPNEGGGIYDPYVPVIPPTQNTGGQSCTTTANQILKFMLPAPAYKFETLHQNETGALEILVAESGTVGMFTIADTVDTTSSADIQFTVSTCPGDFSKTSPCMQHTQYTGGALRFAIGALPASVPSYLASVYCILPAGTTKFYFNFRQVQRANLQIASCPFSTCPFLIQEN